MKVFLLILLSRTCNMDWSHLFSQSFKQAIMITSFVMVMMLIIEFVNVYTRGKFNHMFLNKPVLQIFLASVLGLLPGCLGSYAVVSLFTHNVIGFGGLLATMIATTGDEAFLMFSMFPGKALLISSILLIIAVISGLSVYLINKKKNQHSLPQKIGFQVHESSKNECFSIKWEAIYQNLRFISFKRAIFLVTLSLVITGLALGAFENFHGHTEIPTEHMHEHEHIHEQGHTSWVGTTFLILSVVALLVSLLATNHFLDHHLWEHIVKVHFLRIFLWTFGTLLTISLLTEFMDIDNWIMANKYIILIIAVFVGLIPVSGPHIIFITMFFSGTIPLSILLANSIVQDGHGALPLFAESKINFIKVKAIKVAIALLIGSISLFAGA